MNAHLQPTGSAYFISPETAAAGEETDDAGENARLVVDEDRKRMALGRCGFRRNEIGGAGGLKVCLFCHAAGVVTATGW